MGRVGMEGKPAGRAWAVLFAALLAATPASGQLRIVNYNVAQRAGNQAALQAVFAALNADDKPGFATAPALYVFQEVHTVDTTPLLTLLNAVAPPGVSYARGTYTNNNEDTSNVGAQAMYYRTDLLAEDLSGHVDIPSGAGRNADRWRLQLLNYASPPATFYIYSMHLKASTGSANEQTRLTGATAIRNNADALPAGTHIIYAGDTNEYSNTEPAYQKFVSAGVAQAIDPLGSGNWTGAGNAIKHTQAPCLSGCALVGGGMDDRFDQQLSTAAFQDGAGLSLIPGTYRSFGNDGNHYNNAINAGNNFYYPADLPRSNALANNLFTASDHVPVVADYQVPAVMQATLPADFGRVIQGAGFSVQLAVSNAAVALVAQAADELAYSAVASGGLSGTAGGTVAALASPATAEFPVDTSTVGPVGGAVDVTTTSQGAQNASLQRTTSGTILRHANASWSAGADVDDTTASVMLPADSGVQPIAVPLFNLGHDSLQALLDVDAVIGLSPPFALGAAPPMGIDATGAALSFTFDTTGAAPGTHSVSLQVQVSDEDLPGATGGEVALTLEVVVQPQGLDINCDGATTMDDVDTFVQVLLGQDTTPCHVARSDVDQSGVADGADIWALTHALLAP